MRRQVKSVLKVRQPHFDGAGAQILRVVSAFAISKRWGLDFCYDRLGTVDTQIFSNQDESNLWNGLLVNLIPEHLNKSHNRLKPIIHKNHRPWLLHKKIQIYDLAGKPRLHVIDSPQVIMNKFPEYLMGLDFEEQIAKYRRLRSHDWLRVVIHIRQGELALSQFKERYLDLKYFEGVLATMEPILDFSQLPYEIIVCTEPNQDRLISANDPRVIASLQLDSNNPNVKKVNETFYKFVQEMPSLEETPILMKSNWLHNQSAYQDFLELLNADILVLSKSSFSYLAGLLNSNALVISPRFWHPQLPSWVSMKDKSSLESGLKTKIKEFRNA